MKHFHILQIPVRHAGKGLLLLTCLLSACLAKADNTQTNTSSAVANPDADAAWKELQKLLRPPMPPAEWQGRPTPEQIQEFRTKQGALAAEAADKAKDFYTKYPTYTKAAEARKAEAQMLQFAVQLGNTNKIAALEEREKEQLKDPNLSEDERYKLRMQAVQRLM